MNHDVFISYLRADAVCDALNNAGKGYKKTMMT